MAYTGTLQRKRSTRGSSGGWEEPGRSFSDAIAWIAQQKRLVETASWGDDPAAIEQQLINHQKFHSSIQRSPEVDRAKDDLAKKGDKANLHVLEQEWDNLQQLSFGRAQQLRDLQQIIQQISTAIMWVNDREEEELVFDWGDKNIDQYIPKKQESYSKLMSALEDKEKDLNKLKAKVDVLLKNNHPASDKIEAYQDTLQTQWSWLLQITKCIDIHLKENAAYSQFFKEANETYSTLQKEHETIRKKFTCDKNTSLENLLELLRGLEREREKIMENKRQVQHLVNKSKSIVRLKPRNPEEKSSSPVIVKALCDFKQDQKVICKDNEAILKDNSQRSKWDVTGPGGLDMLVPSVCLIVPPPNPLSVSLAKKNEQYYEAILAIWNQLYINVKSLIAWQYCLLDIKHINSLTMTMLAKMRPEDYRQIFKNLENHFEEFKLSCHNSQMFDDEDKRRMETQVSGAQTHYEQLVVQLPTYKQTIRKETVKGVRDERKKQGSSSTSSSIPSSYSSSRSLSELHALRLRLEGFESLLSQHVHICFGDDGVKDCGLMITQLETAQRDINSMREEYLRLRERILKELEGINDPDKAEFLRSEIEVINKRLGSLESISSAYLQRLQALRDMLQSIAQVEDIVKVHEARLTEKETTSLSTSEVQDYVSTLKSIKAELELKKNVLASMETQLANVSHWNSQVGGPYYRCDMMLSKYTEQVGLLSDRWKRIQGQIDTRLQDLQLYLPQLQHYTQTSTSLTDWIDATRKKQDSLQNTKIETVQALNDHINKQKALNTEIKAKRETVDSVLKDNDSCVRSVKDYETDLASYTSGLETLLNIPIKRTMLKSPTMDLNQEATQLQTRYMELFTLSGDYYKFLGELLKSMEELKIRNTRIDLLEEELRLLRENVQDHSSKNKSLEDALARYQLQLSQSQEQLLSIEEVKRNTAMQCSATKDSLNTTQSQLSDLNDQVGRLNYLLEEEKRKRRLAEERYTHQQEEYELVLRKRQKELETVSWSKLEVEKSVATKDQELEQLRRQLADEAINNIKLTMMQSIQSEYSDIVKERDALLLKLQLSENGKDRLKMLEDELGRIKLSLDSELRNKQRLQEENDRVKRDLSYWKDQYDSKQSLIRQYDTDKEYLEREKNALKSEIERLMRELRELEETYKSRLSTIQKEMHEMTTTRIITETELRRTREKCKTEPSTGLLLLPEPKMPLTVRGLRGEVSVIDLVDANLLKQSDVDQVNQGRLTRQDIEDRLRSYLRGSTCIAGVYDEANDKVIPIYQAMKDGLLRRGTTLELLEAQAASGFMVDPINNLYLTVSDAYSKNLFGPEFKDSLLAAESAVTGYKTPGTNKIISLFQAMEKGLIEKGHGIRLLQAQIASGGIIDPEHSHRIDVNVAYKRGYFNEAINKILTDEGDETKGFFDPNTDENLTYLQLKKRCITDKKTGLILLPIMNKKKQESTQKNTTRKRRVLIVDPETNREMTVREAYDKKFIDYDTYLELSQQECEWDEITITAPDGSVKFVIIDRKTGRQYDISELLEKKVIDQSVLDKYRSHVITLTEFADIITNKTTHGSFSSSTASSVSQDLPGSLKHISSVSVNLPSQEPVGAIFDTENVEKISITEALNRGLVDAITAQRLLEAQACTGGIINPANGRRLSIQEASRLGIINDEMATKLKPAQKAYLGFEDVKTKKKMSVAQAMKEMWVPYEAGQRFMEFQFVTGGLYDPEMECRRTLEDALKMGWLDERAALKLQDIKSHAKNLTCPKSKLKISYKEALDNSLVEESTGVRMLQASSVSSRGISSPYNVSSAPGSTTGSRSGSRQGSRRSSVDLSSPSSSLTGHYSYSFTSFSSTR
uniref:Desmoplakin b n=1 Tax=Mastacembelus armatus TaxID=205130 RepID=A0A7N9AQE0_9TELE